MTITRDELVATRKFLFDRLENLRRTGDYGAGAADIREVAEVVLKLLDDRLERFHDVEGRKIGR